MNFLKTTRYPTWKAQTGVELARNRTRPLPLLCPLKSPASTERAQLPAPRAADALPHAESSYGAHPHNSLRDSYCDGHRRCSVPGSQTGAAGSNPYPWRVRTPTARSYSSVTAVGSRQSAHTVNTGCPRLLAAAIFTVNSFLGSEEHTLNKDEKSSRANPAAETRAPVVTRCVYTSVSHAGLNSVTITRRQQVLIIYALGG